MRRALAVLCLLPALALAPGPAHAACPSLPETARLALALIDRREPPRPPIILSMEEAACARDRLVATLSQPWGDQVGWKVEASAAGPLVGALFFGTLRERAGESYPRGGEPTMPAAYGTLPRLGAGLLMRILYDGVGEVGDDHVSLLRHLDAVMPFLDLSEAIWPEALRDPGLRLATNLGTRLGVVGEEIAPEPTPAFARALGEMTVTLAQGAAATQGIGAGPAGHPLDVFGGLAREMREQGRRLQAGEHVAIMLGPTLPSTVGEAVVTLSGLTGSPVRVGVRLE
jgi:2-keto-4-pentenoate hydratase